MTTPTYVLVVPDMTEDALEYLALNHPSGRTGAAARELLAKIKAGR